MWEDQSQEMQAVTKSQIIHNKAEIEWAFAPFKTQDLPTGRVLLIPEGHDPYVCYMSDESNSARLIIDDYVPELGIDLGKKEEESGTDLP